MSEFSSRAKYRGAQGTAQSAARDSGALSFGSVFLDALRVLWASKENDETAGSRFARPKVARRVRHMDVPNEHAASARKKVKQLNG